MKILVAGLGKSGISAARLALDRGHGVLALDANPRESLSHDLDALEALGLRIAHGEVPPEGYAGLDLLILSPGWPRASRIVREALGAGVEVIGELEWALRHTGGRVAAVTGSNGKSTTTTLLGALMAGHYDDVRTGGNLGTPACDLVAGSSAGSWFVLELSSFQLESVARYRAEIALLLNVTPDHQDRYPSFEDYAAAKGEVFRNQGEGDWALYNGTDPVSVSLAAKSAGRRLPFSIGGPLEEGVFLQGDAAVLRVEGQEEVLFRRADLPLPGSHNLENALAACAAARLAGVPAASIASTLRTFGGLAHRLEKVAVVNGAAVYNDSKATNTDAVLKALTAFEAGVVLLLGGKDKGADWASLLPEARKRCKAVVAFGKARPAVEAVFAGALPLKGFDTLREATPAALAMAGAGDTVLLSPACASFDEFRNFEDRGDHFRRWVRGEGG